MSLSILTKRAMECGSQMVLGWKLLHKIKNRTESTRKHVDAPPIQVSCFISQFQFLYYLNLQYSTNYIICRRHSLNIFTKLEANAMYSQLGQFKVENYSQPMKEKKKTDFCCRLAKQHNFPTCHNPLFQRMMEKFSREAFTCSYGGDTLGSTFQQVSIQDIHS